MVPPGITVNPDVRIAAGPLCLAAADLMVFTSFTLSTMSRKLIYYPLNALVVHFKPCMQ